MAFTLPHTEITLPTPVTVAGYDQLEMASGVAYTTTLHINGTHVGTIENDGRGGDTWLRTTNAHRPAWKALIKGARNRHGDPMDEEELCERLVDEADLQQQFDRRQSAGQLPVRLEAHGQPVGISGMPGVHALGLTPDNAPYRFERARMPEQIMRADVWVEGRWVQIKPMISQEVNRS